MKMEWVDPPGGSVLIMSPHTQEFYALVKVSFSGDLLRQKFPTLVDANKALGPVPTFETLMRLEKEEEE